jgi:hypothetical protein
VHSVIAPLSTTITDQEVYWHMAWLALKYLKRNIKQVSIVACHTKSCKRTARPKKALDDKPNGLTHAGRNATSNRPMTVTQHSEQCLSASNSFYTHITWVSHPHMTSDGGGDVTGCNLSRWWGLKRNLIQHLLATGFWLPPDQQSTRIISYTGIHSTEEEK